MTQIKGICQSQSLKSLKRQSHTLKLLKKISQKRGDIAEMKVNKALSLLKENGEINGYYFYPKFSRWDKQGIDAVFFVNKQQVWLQVKSSRIGVKNHYKKYGKNALIFMIIVKPEEGVDDVYNKLLAIIKNL